MGQGPRLHGQNTRKNRDVCPGSVSPAFRNPRRVGLVGCVKEKAPSRRAARDLYTSKLFEGRRRYVESTCDTWWILSAEHGLVDPDELLDPYDTPLKSARRDDRRRWSNRVLAAIDTRVGLVVGDVIEIHAGAEYRDSGLVLGLGERGISVVNPTEGMGIGTQLRFYKLEAARS